MPRSKGCLNSHQPLPKNGWNKTFFKLHWLMSYGDSCNCSALFSWLRCWKKTKIKAPAQHPSQVPTWCFILKYIWILFLLKIIPKKFLLENWKPSSFVLLSQIFLPSWPACFSSSRSSELSSIGHTHDNIYNAWERSRSLPPTCTMKAEACKKLLVQLVLDLALDLFVDELVKPQCIYRRGNRKMLW